MLTIGKNQYKLILLDTNAIHEIVQNSHLSGKGFLEKFCKGGYCSCFSWYSLVELKPKADIYAKLKEFFGIVPTLLIMPYKAILQREYDANKTGIKFVFDTDIVFQVTPKFLEQAFSKGGALLSTVESELKEAPKVARIWQNQRSVDSIAYKHLQQHESDIVRKFLCECGIYREGDAFSIKNLPAARLMTFIQITKTHGQRKPVVVNDVVDTMISAIVPYVDAVITENNQANLFKQAKSFISELSDLEIYTLKDIRQ